MKNKFIWMALVFVLGAVIGILIFWLSCCCCKQSCQESCEEKCGMSCQGDSMNLLPGVRQISADTAHAYFKCYMKSPMSCDTVKGFMVNLEQLNAMNMLAKKDSTLKGFRIYMGIYGDPEPVDEVVAVAPDGSDNISTIYMTPAANSGLCPPNCDIKSPITTPGK